MSRESGIEWTDATWNPVVGCDPVSPGCANCYARPMSLRLGRAAAVARAHGRGHHKGDQYAAVVGNDGHWTGLVRCLPEALGEPLGWRGPRRVFVCSMSDLLQRAVPDEFVASVLAVCTVCPDLEFRILTKRAERLAELLPALGPQVYEQIGQWLDLGAAPNARRRAAPHVECFFRTGPAWDRADAVATAAAWPPGNVRVGISAEDQRTFDLRIFYLLRLAGAGWPTFLSLEPLLEPIDCRVALGRGPRACGCGGLCDSGMECPMSYNAPRVGQVIIGGETGPGARPMRPAWVRAIRDECVAARVPFFFKQWGEWATERSSGEQAREPRDLWSWGDGTVAWRVGRRVSGRLLDGREWNGQPADSINHEGHEGREGDG